MMELVPFLYGEEIVVARKLPGLEGSQMVGTRRFSQTSLSLSSTFVSTLRGFHHWPSSLTESLASRAESAQHSCPVHLEAKT